MTRTDIGTAKDPNKVVETLLAVRKMKSSIVVQANLLYPFISVSSLNRGYLHVKGGAVSSALGSPVNIASESNLDVITKSDLGIFTVYRASIFKKSCNRVCPPVQMIGIKALEMISLRSKIDIDLYELVINSGYEL